MQAPAEAWADSPIPATGLTASQECHGAARPWHLGWNRSQVSPQPPTNLRQSLTVEQPEAGLFEPKRKCWVCIWEEQETEEVAHATSNLQFLPFLPTV